MKNTVAIIQFPGSNTERETFMACERTGIKAKEFLWNTPPHQLSKFSGYIIIGGFSYEDRSRAGIIAALDPIMNQIKIEASKGKPVLGICNGAQILVESGLVPGANDNITCVSLTDNKRIKNGRVVGVGYYNTWAKLKMSSESNRCAFTRHMKKSDLINIPLAHAEGRFLIPEPLLNEMIENKQTVFRYCDSSGRTVDEFPTNPNGSIYNLAGICNTAGNVMAMMPHPERTSNGDVIFSSMKEFIKKRYPIINKKLSYKTKSKTLADYIPSSKATTWRISTIITDNVASSVHQTLKSFGCEIKIHRQINWEIEIEENKNHVLEQIDASGELYNSNKEFIDESKDQDYDLSLLILQKDDVHARMKQESLTNRFEIGGIKKIKRGVLWNLSLISGNIQDVLERIINSNILYNQESHECYRINQTL